ncbi:MAG TPA: RNA polymerase sigma factor [Candidatus Paceibacterota bacterium]
MTVSEFTKLYDDYADAIYRYCFFRLSQNKALAEDLVQETYMRTWKAVASGQQIDNGKTFLFTVAHNLVIDTYRKKQTFSLDNLTDAGFSPEDKSTIPPQTQAEISEMLVHINKLPDNYRQVILLRFVENLGPKDIAEIVGESENNVSVRLNRAITQLKNEMNPE